MSERERDLLELGGGECVLDLLGALRQTLPAGQEGEESLPDLGVGEDRSHHLWGTDTGQVHYTPTHTQK